MVFALVLSNPRFIPRLPGPSGEEQQQEEDGVVEEMYIPKSPRGQYSLTRHVSSWELGRMSRVWRRWGWVRVEERRDSRVFLPCAL